MSPISNMGRQKRITRPASTLTGSVSCDDDHGSSYGRLGRTAAGTPAMVMIRPALRMSSPVLVSQKT
jgi:hypothetical protein